MNDVAIQVEHLSKRYRIGMYEERQESLGGMLFSFLKSPFSNFKKLQKLTKFTGEEDADIIWALNDINFQVETGEVVGIIGRNGAGKSTLLKILSQIAEPTEGKAVIRGKVSSLLEVGTGFHPELTGRENIYLNGTIMGMRKEEIDSKFEEIVEFSGINKFIDTPIKRYSSGMKVRLAFSVAAHLEPEILLVDEVLAVGDLAFQKKCLGKMEDVTQKGRTILFVSHNMMGIKNLCKRTILIEDGKIYLDGNTEEVIKEYYNVMKMNAPKNIALLNDSKNRRGLGHARFNRIELTDKDGKTKNTFHQYDDVYFKFAYAVIEDISELYIAILIKSDNTEEILTSVKHMISKKIIKKGNKKELIIKIPNINLRPGTYPLYYWLGNRYNKPYDVIDRLTVPLEIIINPNVNYQNYNPNKPSGYFDIESNVL